MTTSSDITPVLEAHMLISLAAPITVLSVTDSIEDLLGFKAGDFLTGKVSLNKQIHAHDQDIAGDLFSIGTNRTPRTFNIRIRQANGRIRCIRGHYSKEPGAFGADVVLELLLQDAKTLSRSQNQSQKLCEQAVVFNFKAMMENTNDYIYFKDSNHVFTGASQTLVTITEPTEHWTDLLGLTDYDVFAEEYADIYYRLEKQVFSGVLIAHEEQEILDNKGNKGWVDNRKYPIKDERGEIIGLFGIARDITERKCMEDEIKANEARFRSLVENSPLCIHELDRDSKLTSINRAGVLMLGAKNENAVLGQPYLGAVDVSDRENIKELLAKVYAGQTSHFEFKVNGSSERIFKSCFVPITNNQGVVEKLMGITEDITEYRQAQDALKQGAARIEMMLNSVAEGIYGVDMQGYCTFINSAGLHLLGYRDESELIGKHMHDLIHHTHPDGSHYPFVECRLYTCLQSQEDVHVDDESFWRKDGSCFPVDYWSRPIMQNGEHGAVITFIDITERKKIEVDLRIAATVFESQEGMLISDANNIILRVNRAFTKITGYSAEEVIGKNPRILQSGRQDTVFYTDM